jgi:copper chaperone NosL
MKLVAITFLLLTFFSSAVFSGERTPVVAGPKDKCPVCGMFVKKYPDWMCQVVFKDGSYAVFDGTKDMFKYVLDLKRYNPSRKASDIDSIYVTDYYGLHLIDGYAAGYVIGSDVYGPMGHELIPFSKTTEAREFMKDHKGKSILKFHEVTPERLKGLD